MDTPIQSSRFSKINIFKQFEPLDIVPYSLAVSLLFGSIYIVVLFLEITKRG